MLTPEERYYLKKNRVYRYYEMETQFELVTSFYPAQRLTIEVNIFDIMNIMNYTGTKATALLYKIGKKTGDKFISRIRTSVFCEYMDIDEMLIQVFLASMKLVNEPLPPKKRLRPLTLEQIKAERPRSMYEIAEQLRKGILENSQTLALRAKLYEEENPYGEPLYKRLKFVQMVIRAFEVAQIFDCHIATAQQMLREVREKEYPYGIKRRSVSIKKFCAVHNEDEEDLRKHLAELHGDDEDDYD